MRRWDHPWHTDYVSVAQRKQRAQRSATDLGKKGQSLSPVVVEGRAVATTFWGKAWCEHLERFSDYDNRLPRGRSYVRSGAVLDLQIEPGTVRALVRGTSLYRVAVVVRPVGPASWREIARACAGKVDSLVELLQGRFDQAVMRVVGRADGGLFPRAEHITLSCSCPDWATMCKHVAATLYGVGARLDRQPELLFRLRDVDPAELVAGAPSALGPVAGSAGARLDAGALEGVFDLEFDSPSAAAGPPEATSARRARAPSKTAATPKGGAATAEKVMRKARAAKAGVAASKGQAAAAAASKGRAAAAAASKGRAAAAAASERKAAATTGPKGRGEAAGPQGRGAAASKGGAATTAKRGAAAPAASRGREAKPFGPGAGAERPAGRELPVVRRPRRIKEPS